MAHTNRYKDLQLTQLRSFCLVAVRANFSVAAKELGLSTPTVWQQVRALETTVGAKLLRHHGRSLELTDEGRLLLELVQPHVSGMDALARLFEDRRKDIPQRVVVAAPYLLAYHLPDAVDSMSTTHPAARVRNRARRLIEQAHIHEVALPLERDGDWDPTGWLRGATAQPLARHAEGSRAQAQHGVPALANVAQLRKLLGIRSPRQLGYFLLASDAEDGPYTKFTIPKRDGRAREICAPKKQLRWVQRQILDKILAEVRPHAAAHGFVPGRSTVTNAARHQGAAVILKFDLTDFFPTVHYYRVVGLFASLGYSLGNGHFASRDDSLQVAPTLARLCCHSPDPHEWGTARLPQGAPTSPAISNLVCRRLDARLDGLVRRNDGAYTRYADDLTFSFKDATLDLGRLRWWVDQVCHQEGFFVNHSKFHVIRASQRQVVTGIVVNDELHVPRDARRRFRAILHNCRKYGVESQAGEHARFAEYLRGFASYVHMVQPGEGAALLKEVDELLGPETDRRFDCESEV